MKRCLFLSLFLCFLGSACCIAGNLSKEALKSHKKVCKQLKKDGWTTYDKVLPLEDAMMQYYLLMEAGADSLQQVIGMGRDMNPNTAYKQAKHQASVSRATQKGINIKVFTETIMSSSAGCSTEVNTFTHVEQSLRSLTPVVSLCRKMKDGTTEVNLYYLYTGNNE